MLDRVEATGVAEERVAERHARPANRVDREFSDAETEFSGLERAMLVRDLMAELTDYDSQLRRTPAFFTLFCEREADGSGGLKHYFLPDIPDPNGGDLAMIREGYGRRAVYYQSDARIFLWVGQGEMWSLPKSARPYAKITMSECSALVGNASDRLLVAHISYSACNQLEAAVDFMRQAGLAPDQLFVVASVGRYQETSSAQNARQRATVADYMRLKIPKANLRMFTFEPAQAWERDSSRNDWIDRGLAEVLVSPRFILVSRFDLKSTRRANWTPKEERFGPYRHEDLIEFTN